MRKQPRRRQRHAVVLARFAAGTVLYQSVRIDDDRRRVVVDMGHGSHWCLNSLRPAAEKLAAEVIRPPVRGRGDLPDRRRPGGLEPLTFGFGGDGRTAL